MSVNEQSSFDDVDVDDDSEVEVYTVNGILEYSGSRSDMNLSRGIYIMRQGTHSSRIIIK